MQSIHSLTALNQIRNDEFHRAAERHRQAKLATSSMPSRAQRMAQTSGRIRLVSILTPGPIVLLTVIFLR